jgi:hypothetical protein
MTVTVDSFRQSFMAFGDDQQFPPSELTYWITSPTSCTTPSVGATSSTTA